MSHSVFLKQQKPSAVSVLSVFSSCFQSLVLSSMRSKSEIMSEEPDDCQYDVAGGCITGCGVYVTLVQQIFVFGNRGKL